MADSIPTKPKIRTMLVSQPKPEPGERTPIMDFGARHGIKVDYRPFIEVKGITAREFRRTRIAIGDYPAVIFNSRNAVDHYFRLCEEMRVEIESETRYFCISENVGHYLQRYTQLRKRKIALGKGKLEDLLPQMIKHKELSYLMPCADVLSDSFLLKAGESDLKITKAIMFQTVSSDLSDLADIKYDVLCFFSPVGIKSLFENFPNFVQNDTRIAALGTQTHEAVLQRGLRLDIAAPTPEFPSLVMALEACLKKPVK